MFLMHLSANARKPRSLKLPHGVIASFFFLLARLVLVLQAPVAALNQAGHVLVQAAPEHDAERP